MKRHCQKGGRGPRQSDATVAKRKWGFEERAGRVSVAADSEIT